MPSDYYVAIVVIRLVAGLVGVGLSGLAVREARADQRVARLRMTAMTQSVARVELYREGARFVCQVLCVIAAVNVLVTPALIEISTSAQLGWKAAISSFTITCLSVVLCADSWLYWWQRRRWRRGEV